MTAPATVPMLPSSVDEIARLVTAQPFTVRILAGGVDVTARSPVALVRYLPDGTGWRRLHDGRTVPGHWRFLDETRTLIEVSGPEGLSRWLIVELDAHIYRKIDLETGVEFIHTPAAE